MSDHTDQVMLSLCVWFRDMLFRRMKSVFKIFSRDSAIERYRWCANLWFCGFHPSELETCSWKFQSAFSMRGVDNG